jgi:Family of unknown function (DUF6510)
MSVVSIAPGFVLRCHSCEGVLLRTVVSSDRAWVDMTGLAYLQVNGDDFLGR